MKKHKIDHVVPGSIADEMEIAGGDLLLSVNGQELRDVFDYDYLINDEEVTLLIEKPDGEQWELEIGKDPDQDIGIVFEDALLDKYRACSNRCIFCFIDQMPRGMRKTLYFKDDDARLSFLQGNYVTLTNMSDADIERIIHFHLAPINVSVHTTNPELRVRMLRNKNAGKALEKLWTLADAGIEMNSQIVLCKGYNDGSELDRTIGDLADLYPSMQSLSVVPIGMTKFRQKLTQVEPFTQEDIKKTLDQILGWQQKLLKKLGTRFVHASDEFFIMAHEEIPQADYYEGYGQIENGVGMVRSFLDDLNSALVQFLDAKPAWFDREKIKAMNIRITSPTGVLFGPYLKKCAERISDVFGITYEPRVIVNDYFGHGITVTGLITATDLIAQMKDTDTGDLILIPDSMLRSGEEVFLDDLTVTDVAKSLQTDTCIVKSGGDCLVEAVSLFLEGKVNS